MKLQFALAGFLLLLLLPTAASASSVTTFEHPNDQYELSRNPSPVDREKELHWKFGFEAGGVGVIEYAIIPKEAPCSQGILDYSGDAFIEPFFTKTIYADEADPSIEYDINLVDAFAVSGAFDGDRAVWQDPHDSTVGKFVCGIAASAALSSEGDFEIHLSVIKIYANFIDKAGEAIQDQISDPFGAGNLWWTVGIVVGIIAISFLVYWFKFKKK